MGDKSPLLSSSSSPPADLGLLKEALLDEKASEASYRDLLWSIGARTLELGRFLFKLQADDKEAIDRSHKGGVVSPVDLPVSPPGPTEAASSSDQGPPGPAGGTSTQTPTQQELLLGGGEEQTPCKETAAILEMRLKLGFVMHAISARCYLALLNRQNVHGIFHKYDKTDVVLSSSGSAGSGAAAHEGEDPQARDLRASVGAGVGDWISF